VVVQPILRPAQAPVRSSPGERPRFLLAGAALAALLLLAFGVFFYLPTLVEQPAEDPAPPLSPAATPQPAPRQETAPADIDYQALAEQMRVAEESRDAYQALFEEYDQRNATQWGGDAFASARGAGEEADRQFKAREFPAARENYRKGLAWLQQVSETATRLVHEQLQAGERAIAQGQSAAARKAFEFALNVEPDNATAQRGLKRAETLDEVFSLTAAAAAAERAGRLPDAVRDYEEALKLDPETAAASEGLARAKNLIASNAYAAAMSKAMSALSEGDPAAARQALAAAGRIRPAAPEVQNGLARAAELERQQQVVGHQQKGEEFERSERWKEALAEYEAALKVDPALAYALQGRARVQPRLGLHQQFEELNASPERLLSAAVRTQASALLAEAKKVASPGPVLSRQVEQLSAALAQARIPMPVVLRSDNQTQVAINRATQLGTFSQHRLDLLPGRYVLIGTRQGYRDVRRELTVLPGKTPDPVTIQCEERI
jgi:hypothetical protein